ncbi:MAG: hypothetical protein J6P40_11430, partial [Oscillospiraceae bacterium]|nr:hypothetical protein [Oscillospiraceae bacterium]
VFCFCGMTMLPLWLTVPVCSFTVSHRGSISFIVQVNINCNPYDKKSAKEAGEKRQNRFM